MRRSLQFARIITVLAVVLGFRAYPASAQHAASSLSVSTPSQARVASTPVSAPHAATIGTGVAGNRQSSVASSRHSSSILASGSKFPPTNHPRPGKPVRTTGFYWIFDGGAYWVPAQGDAATDQSPADQANLDQISGGQSVDSGQNGSSRVNASGVNASLQQNSADAAGPAGDDSAASSASEARAEGAFLPDEGQFTLVLNDGRWIEAVAFTRSNDTIVYITAAGSRYTIAASELDSESTLRVNQERGTPLQSPL